MILLSTFNLHDMCLGSIFSSNIGTFTVLIIALFAFNRNANRSFKYMNLIGMQNFFH